MRYASVCDGIGAAHVAWKPLGWECAWTSEIEPFPAAVVEQRFGYPNVGDMTRITEEMLDGYGPVDLLVGGTPCQSFSVAGLRGGLADPRGNLALRFVQLAAVMQPKWIVWENVPGVLSSGKGRDFGTFLGALGELGYGFAYRILDAQWFGVAQRRRRVFVVGHLGDWRRAAAVLFERESVFGNPPTRGKAWEGVARSTAASLTSSGRGVERCGESRGQDDVVLAGPLWRGGDQANSEHCYDHAGTLNCDKGQQGGIVVEPHAIYSNDSRFDGIPPAGLAPPLKIGSDGGGNPPAVAWTKSKRAQSVTDDETWVPGEVSPTMSCFDQGDTRATTVVAYDITGTLATNGAKSTDVRTALRGRPPGQSEASTTTVVTTPIDLRQASRGEKVTNNRTGGSGGPPGHGVGDSGDPAFTVSERGQAVASFGISSDAVDRTGEGDGSAGERAGLGIVEEQSPCLRARASNSVSAGMAVRRLTPRECERLQGFPDDYTLVTHRGKPAADGPRYRALGNSMAVPVMRWIGERIEALRS